MKKFLSLGLITLSLAVVAGCGKTDTDNTDQDLKQVNKNLEQLMPEELEDSNKMSGEIKGSCDAIEESSTCIEYYGSFWTEQNMPLACTETGKFSTKGCPRDMAGGCNIGTGTPSDMVAWMYTRGGGEVTAEALGYAKMACDATLSSAWVTAK